jgi:hypothetical protein
VHTKGPAHSIVTHLSTCPQPYFLLMTETNPVPFRILYAGQCSSTACSSFCQTVVTRALQSGGWYPSRELCHVQTSRQVNWLTGCLFALESSRYHTELQQHRQHLATEWTAEGSALEPMSPRPALKPPGIIPP